MNVRCRRGQRTFSELSLGVFCNDALCDLDMTKDQAGPQTTTSRNHLIATIPFGCGWFDIAGVFSGSAISLWRQGRHTRLILPRPLPSEDPTGIVPGVRDRAGNSRPGLRRAWLRVGERRCSGPRPAVPDGRNKPRAHAAASDG